MALNIQGTFKNTDNESIKVNITNNEYEHDFRNDYFTIIPLEDGVITWRTSAEQHPYYSIDDGETWVEITNGESTPIVPAFTKILWKGEITPVTSGSIPGVGRFSNTTIKFDVEGNIMSLLHGDDFADKFDLTGPTNTFRFLFYTTNVVHAHNLILPYILANSCFRDMFHNCACLLTPPKLPAPRIGQYAYRSMFQGCTSLQYAPELPATSLASSCYYGMFNGCASLTKAPFLPYVSVVTSMYGSMFAHCPKLNYVHMNLASASWNDSNTANWLLDVSPTGTFVISDQVQWNLEDHIGESGIPEGWEVRYVHCQTPLTFTLLEDGQFSFSMPGISYSLDGSETWVELDANELTPKLYAGTSIAWAGHLTPIQVDPFGVGRFTSTGKFNISGTPLTLIHGYELCNDTTIKPTLKINTEDATQNYNTFRGLFAYTNVVSAEEMTLPSMGLTYACYRAMFAQCTDLILPPKELPAQSPAQYCYYFMFHDCTSMIKSPVIHLVGLGNNNYNVAYMFDGCSSLKSIEIWATNVGNTNSRLNWVRGVSSEGTMIIDPVYAKSWTSKGDNSIPLNYESDNICNYYFKPDVEVNMDDEYNICLNNMKLYFSGEPITIKRDFDDLFEPIIKHSASVSFVTDSYLGDYLFANKAQSVSIKVKNEDTDTILFNGYIEPNTFSQPFAHGLDDFSLNCIDYLSILEYKPYKNIQTEDEYKDVKLNSGLITFKQLFYDMFKDADDLKLYIEYGNATYDENNGKSLITNSIGDVLLSTDSILGQLKISENIMLGDEYDDLMMYDEILEEILKYLNMYIVQYDKNIYVYYINNDTNQAVKSFVNPFNRDDTITININQNTVTQDDYFDDSTTLTIDDVYNQIVLTCSTDTQDSLIESPLDSDSLSSNYTGKQLYMTEYISEGTGDSAHDGFVDIVRGGTSDYASRIDWFIQAMRNENWRMKYNGTDLNELVQIPGLSTEHTSGEAGGRAGSGALTQENIYTNQWAYAWYLKHHSFVPYIFKLGSVERKSESTDNSLISKIDMKPYLFISVNGNENDGENTHVPSDSEQESVFNANGGYDGGMIEYLGSTSGGTLTPPDKNTTNYLIFSGKMLLQPIVYESSSTIAKRTNNFQDIFDNGARKSEGVHANVPYYDGEPPIPHNIVKSDNNEEGRYYTRKFYCAETPADGNKWYFNNGDSCMQPWTKDKSAQGYTFDYSAIGDGSDRISKIPVLECMLIVGDKILVENKMDELGNSEFTWYKIGEEPYWQDSEGHNILVDGQPVIKRTFSLGFNPKIGDYIIGQEYDLQNTIDYTMNIDAEGTAIPITYDDKISGQVYFKILGLVNNTWNQITRRHPSFWRHTSWSSSVHYLLSHIENVIIKDFKCKIYTNNGNYENETDNDLIYMSDEVHDYIKKKDNLKLNIITQPTTDECVQLGISTGVYMNSVIIESDDEKFNDLPVYQIWNPKTGLYKAEQTYVNELYNAYRKPKIKLDTKLHFNNYNVFDEFKFRYINKFTSMRVESAEIDVRNNSINMTVREH